MKLSPLVPVVTVKVNVSAMLVVAYTIAYAVGSLISSTLLVRLLGTRNVRPWAGFVVRLLIATAVAAGVTWVMDLIGHDTLITLHPVASWPLAAVRMCVDGLVLGVVLLAVAGPLRLTEITDVAETVGRRLGGRLARR